MGRINSAKMSLVLQGSNMNKDAMNKRMSQMLLSSATGKMILGMKMMKAHNDEVNKLFGNKADMYKKIINMVQSKTVIGLMGLAMRKFRANVRESAQKHKILMALSKSATFQQAEMFQRLREHRLKCIFDEKIDGSIRQRIINNLCKTNEHKMFELMRAAHIKLKAHLAYIRKREGLITRMIMGSAMGAMTLGWMALKQNCQMITAFENNERREEEKMREREGGRDDIKKRNQLIKRLTNMGYNLQVMGVNAIREFLKSEQAAAEQARLEFERQQKEKKRILARIMDQNVRFMGMGFRQSFQFMEAEREKEIALMAKQRGIMRRMVDSNTRLMAAGYNKLLEEWKNRNGMLKDKLKFVIKALTDKDAQFTLMAYNAMKQRMLMLSGVGMGDAAMKKVQLIKRLTNSGHNLQVMGVNSIREFLTSARDDEERAREEFERQQKEKDRILRRIMNQNLRFMGMGFRQAMQWMLADRAAEIALMVKQRGIMRRIVDSNVRLMSAGWNKLLEEWKNRNGMLKDKLKFVIKALTDKDAQFTLMAYNAMKQRMLMLNGVGMGDAGMKKCQLIKRLTNQGYNLQVMAVNAVREFLTSARVDEERAREEYERQQKEKDRILRRIMNQNLRFMGMGFRQALQWTVAAREAEIALMAKQRGIMRRIVDSNVRLMSAGWNKLLEAHKARNGMLKEKL